MTDTINPKVPMKTRMQYRYRTARGIATLNKGDDYKLIHLGYFKSEEEAKVACMTHYKKVCKAAAMNFNREIPELIFI